MPEVVDIAILIGVWCNVYIQYNWWKESKNES